MNFYDILEVTKDETKEGIKKAYKNLAIKYHPDKNINLNDDEKKKIEEKFRDIKTAYDVLYDDNKRKEYDMMTNDEKTELYNKFKKYFLNIAPQYSKIYQILINKYYGDENEFREDVNNFNIQNIYNKFYDSIFNRKKEVKTHNKSTIDLNIYGVIHTSLEDRYMGKYCKFIVKKSTNESSSTFIIPVIENEIVLSEEGEVDSNGKKGDIYIKIVCEEHSIFKQLNDSDLLLIKKISISEYFYGGNLNIQHIDGSFIEYNFNNFINKNPIICFKNKGLPKLVKGKKDLNEGYEYVEFNSKYDNIKRGNLYIYFNVDGITNEPENEIEKKYKDTIENTLKELFPPIDLV